MFDYVVVDTWSVLEEKVLTILAAADRLLLVSTPEVTALHGAKRFLELIDSLGYTPHKVLFVLNRAASKGGIDLQIIEEHIKEKLNLTVPNDWALASYAANRGVPLLISHPKSAIARSVVKLAQAVASDEHLVGSGQTSGLLSGLRLPLTVGQRE
jgi:pilus assembly protein CpaE